MLRSHRDVNDMATCKEVIGTSSDAAVYADTETMLQVCSREGALSVTNCLLTPSRPLMSFGTS